MRSNGKRLGAMLLALVMVFSLLPTAAFAVRLDDEIAIDAPDTAADATPAGTLDAGDSAELMTAVTDPTPENGHIYPLTNGMVDAFSWANSDNDKPPYAAIDRDDGTYWHTWYSSGGGEGSKKWSSDSEEKWFQFTLPQKEDVLGVYYYPRSGGNSAANDIHNWSIKTSENGTDWVEQKTGTFTVNNNNRSWDYAGLDSAVNTQYVRIIATDRNQPVAAEFRLVVNAEVQTYTVSGTVTDNNSANVSGATVSIGGKTATTADNGSYSIEGLPNGTYTITVTESRHQNYTASVTVNGATTANVEMKAAASAVTGTVTYGEKGALAGATVTLVTGTRASCDFNENDGTSYSFVQNAPTATTEGNGSYSLNMSSVANGTYRLRVSKDGYGAKLSQTDIVKTDAGVTSGAEGNDVVLDDYEAVDTAYQNLHYSIKTFDFASDIPDISNAANGQENAATAAHDADGGRLKLSFTSNNRTLNLLRLADTPMKNGEVEFDVTRSANSVYFGLGLRVGADKADGDSDFDHWLFVGQFGRPARWGYEYWNKGTGNSRNVWSRSYVESTPTFVANETRHIKVRLENTTVNLWVDGVHIMNNAVLGDSSTLDGCTNTSTPPTAAGDIGFLFGSDQNLGGAEDIYIDNLRVIRFDPAYEVEAGTFTGGTAAITTAAPNAEAKPLPEDKRVPEGDTVIITGTPTSADTHALGNVTAMETSPAGGEAARTISATKNADGTFSFSMPAYNVTVSGTFLPKVASATVTASNGLKVNKEVTASATVAGSGSTEGITYKWYVDNRAENAENPDWQPMANVSDTATITLPEAAYDKLIRVVATGDGEHNTGTAEWASTDKVAAADVETTGITIARNTLKMILNGTSDDTSSEDAPTTVGGTTATLTATINPPTATLTDSSVVWTLEGDNAGDILTLGDGSRTGNVFSKTITAKAVGTATVKATVTSADNVTTYSDTIAVTVVNKVTGVTVKNGETVLVASGSSDKTDLVIYANQDNEGNALPDYPKEANLTLEVAPSGVACTATWSRVDGASDLISLTQQGKIAVTDSTATNVGTKEVKVRVTDDAGKATEVTFNVVVKRKLQNSVTITGTPKYGQTLTANTDNLTVGEGDTLSYKWFRATDANGSGKEEITGATGATYALQKADIEKYIIVEVSAPDNSTYYEGTVSAASAAVERADGPAQGPNGLSGTAPTTQNGSDGTIINVPTDVTYEWSKKDEDSWTAITGTTVTGLEAGDYEVRAKQTDTMKAGTPVTVTVPAYGTTTYAINLDTMTGGTVRRSSNTSAPNATITLTIEPDAANGYQYKANTLKVKKADQSELTLTAGDADNTWTFTMPTEAVTVSAEFELKKLTISHELGAHVTCNSEDHTHKVTYGQPNTQIVLTADEYYQFNPNADGVTITGMASDHYTIAYSNNDGGERGVATITFANGITADLNITINVIERAYSVSYRLGTEGSEGLEAPEDNAPRSVKHKAAYSGKLVPKSELFEVPDDVTITMGGQAFEDFTYANGVITIDAGTITGNLVITAQGKPVVKTIDAVTIENNLVSGNTLHAAVTPSDASATYQWQMADSETGTYNDISSATGSSFLLTADHVGKWFQVVVTGTGVYTGSTKTSAARGPVTAEVIPAEKVTITAPDGSENQVEFGKTLQLTAVTSRTSDDRTPTENTVKWSIVSGEDFVDVNTDSGLVTAKKVGSATIRAQVLKDSDTNGTPTGVGNTITIQVTAAPLTGVTLSSPVKVGVELTATAAPDGATATYQWQIKGEEDEEFTSLSASGNKYTPVAGDEGKTIKVIATGTENYTGTKEVTSSAVLGADVTTYTITVTQPEHGTISSSKTETAAGVTVTLTVEPADGYKLATLTVTDADGAAVTVAADNTFVMPAKNVTVTATFTVKTAEKDALREAVKAAKAAKEGVIATDKTADAVETGTLFVTTLTMTNFTKAIDAAEALLTKADATQDEVDDALATLNAWTTEHFPAAIQNGTMDDRALKSAIKAVRDLKASVFVIDDKTADEVADGVKFVTTQEMAALSRAIKDAETALNAENKNQASLDAAIEPLDAARLVFTVAIKTGTGGESGYVPEVNTDALEAAIADANAAKKGVTVSDKTPAEVNRGTKFVTQEAMDALEKAIEDAQKAKDATDKTDGSVSNAVDALNAAVETFKAAVQIGTKSTGSSSSGNRPSTGTTTETKPDGTKVTTETKPDGTKVVTTESPDGSKEVVETKKDGTVTETKTDAEGGKTEKVTTPDKDVTITVTDKDGEELAKIELPAEIPAPETKFEDVPADHWAEESIHKMASLELVNGTGDNKYSPVAPMTRGALATVLHRLSQGKTDYKATFRDVANGQYYTEGVAWAAKAGVVKGITAELFAPEQSITREQLAVMMARYAKLIGLNTDADADTLDSFTDADQTGDWAVDGMAWCVKVGILQGKGDSILDPTASVSRAEVATMLDRFLAIVVK